MQDDCTYALTDLEMRENKQFKSTTTVEPRREKTRLGVCEQHRRSPDCASAQSDQRLCYSLFGNFYM